MVINADRVIHEIEGIFRHRKDRQEDWSHRNWDGRDALQVQRELDSDALGRIRQLLRGSGSTQV